MTRLGFSIESKDMSHKQRSPLRKKFNLLLQILISPRSGEAISDERQDPEQNEGPHGPGGVG